MDVHSINIVGQVLSRQNIADIIKFAKRENLFILADEVELVQFMYLNNIDVLLRLTCHH